MRINCIFDCQTQDQCCDYFNSYRTDRTPQEDAAFALRKMREDNPFLKPKWELSSDQRDRLEALANHPESTQDWEAYCSILRVDQIHFIGW